MEYIILPITTMVIGFLIGIITADTVGDNKRIDDLERKMKKLERRVNG